VHTVVLPFRCEASLEQTALVLDAFTQGRLERTMTQGAWQKSLRSFTLGVST
jgi:hypothetical protein